MTIAPPLPAAARLLLYAHDTYGLGHLRRSLAIAGYLAQTFPALSTLLVTGSPVAQHFDLPPRVDYVKLPSVVKTGDEQYRARDLALSPEHITRLRAALIREAATHFAPDVILVDHAPLGMKGELLPTLQQVRRVRPQTQVVLGLRDVIDAPQKVQRQWAEHGVYAAMAEYYDRVLVYGQADLFDPVHAYAFPPDLAARTHFCGYIRREEPVRAPADLRAELDLGERPFVLVTAGGGGDGVALEDCFLAALPTLDQGSGLQAVMLTGPLMAPEQRRALEERAQGWPVHLLPFHSDVPGLMRASALVVAMGGYNTLCEVVAANRPSVIVPRTHPRLEQQIRAQAFAARGLVALLPADTLTPRRLATAVRQALARPWPPAARGPWDDGGLPRLSAHMAALLRTQQCAIGSVIA